MVSGGIHQVGNHAISFNQCPILIEEEAGFIPAW